jgi:hypothetical protein
MRAIRTEAQLTSFRSRSDHSVGFSGVTPEMSVAEMVALFRLQNVLVELVIFPKDDHEGEMLDVEKEMEGKTPSQRLRAALFVLYKETENRIKSKDPACLMDTFDSFYSQQMEKIIEWVKRKIDGEKG